MHDEPIEIPAGMSAAAFLSHARARIRGAERTIVGVRADLAVLERGKPSRVRDAMRDDLRDRLARAEQLRAAYAAILPPPQERPDTSTFVGAALAKRDPAPLSLAEIVASTGVKKETARSALRRMIEDGLVTRVDPGGPTRSGTFALTDAGRRTCRA